MPKPQRRKSKLVSELESMLNSSVIILLKDGRLIKGTLKAFDSMHLNLVIYGVTEIYHDIEKKYSKMIIRGDSIEFLASTQ